MKQIALWLFLVLIFLIPSNLFFTLSLENAYVRGIFVDYLVPKIYLSEIVAVVFIVVSGLRHSHKLVRPSITLPIIGAVALLLEQLLLRNLSTSFFYCVQLFTAGFLATQVIKKPALFTAREVKYAVILTLLFQSVLGIYQFTTGHSFYGYRFLGEPNIQNSLSIAHQQVLGSEHVLPYGTTAHPNVLAGCIALYLLISLRYWQTEKTYFSSYSLLFYLTTVVSIVCLFFTQSSSAAVALLLGIGILTGQKFKSVFRTIPSWAYVVIILAVLLLTPLLLTKVAILQPHSSSISRRVVLNQAALDIFWARPVMGVGLLNFTRQLETVAPSEEVVRFIQPAHNVLLLWTAETGMVGLVVLILLSSWAVRGKQRLPSMWLVILPLAAVDHYLLTIQTGLLLAVIFMAWPWVKEE